MLSSMPVSVMTRLLVLLAVSVNSLDWFVMHTETCTKTGMVMIFGEITTSSTVNYEQVDVSTMLTHPLMHHRSSVRPFVISDTMMWQRALTIAPAM